MKASKRAASVSTGMENRIAVYGDRVWAHICDEYTGETFTVAEAAVSVADCLQLSYRTRCDLVRAVLLTVEDEGQGQVRRITSKHWELGG